MSRSQKIDSYLAHTIAPNKSHVPFFPKRTELDKNTAHRPTLYIDLDNNPGLEPPSPTSNHMPPSHTDHSTTRKSVHLDLDVELNVDLNVDLSMDLNLDLNLDFDVF